MILPENNNKAIKDIEAIFYVAKRALGCDFEHHLHSKQDTEEYITPLQNSGQMIWLKWQKKWFYLE